MKAPKLTLDDLNRIAPIVRLLPNGLPERKITAARLYCSGCGLSEPDLADPVGGVAARKLARSRGWKVFTPSRVDILKGRYTLGQLLYLKRVRLNFLGLARVGEVMPPWAASAVEVLENVGPDTPRHALHRAMCEAERHVGGHGTGFDRTVDLCPACKADGWTQA